MTEFDWRGFLTQWSKEIIASGEFIVAPYQFGEPSAEILNSGWLGYSGANEEQLQKAEKRLGVNLPPSYRDFLKVTNGWRQTTRFIYNLWSTEQIEWHYILDTDGTIDEAIRLALPVSDEDYFVYGEDQEPGLYKVEYLKTALQISDWGDSAVYLLNPKVVTPKGEWEAWFLANWLPGVRRYRSFIEMMQAEYQNFLKLKD